MSWCEPVNDFRLLTQPRNVVHRKQGAMCFRGFSAPGVHNSGVAARAAANMTSQQQPSQVAAGEQATMITQAARCHGCGPYGMGLQQADAATADAAAVDTDIGWQGVHHVGFICQDVNKSREFYEGVLGTNWLWQKCTAVPVVQC